MTNAPENAALSAIQDDPIVLLFERSFGIQETDGLDPLTGISGKTRVQ